MKFQSGVTPILKKADFLPSPGLKQHGKGLSRLLVSMEPNSSTLFSSQAEDDSSPALESAENRTSSSSLFYKSNQGSQTSDINPESSDSKKPSKRVRFILLN